MSNTWSATNYAEHAGFVSTLAEDLLAWLQPQAHERILDLGGGDGVLTAKIAASGADVVCADSAPDLLAAAKAKGLAVQMVDGQALDFDNEFDAVFSNAALHWMTAQPAVIAGVWEALKPGGRFIGEMGGHGNVASIRTAARAVFNRHGYAYRDDHVWYFPTAKNYQALLEKQGFRITAIQLFARPTALPTHLEGWLETFGAPLLANIPADMRPTILAEMVELLRPVLTDPQGKWTLDYVRLRFCAVKER